MTLQSEISFKVNIKEITKVIRILCTDDEIRDLGLMNYMPVRTLDLIGRRQKVNLTYLDHDPLDFKWTWRTKYKPSPSKSKKIIALYLAKVTCWIMENHTYRFNGDLFHQKSGTPIGLQIAVQISRIVMIDWDQSMTTILISTNLRMELLLRYVDDVNVIVLVENKDNLNRPDLEEQTAKTILDLADSINPGILKFEIDCPSRNVNGRLAILDLECWVNLDNQVQLTFYKKTVSTDNVLGPDSGFTPSVLRNILLQEYMRRLLNNSRNLDRQIKLSHISKFNLDLMNAGHTEGFRLSLTSQAIKSYDNMLTTDNLFRTREEIQEHSKNRPDKSNWYKQSGDVDVILNVPPTPDQELLDVIRGNLNKIDQSRGTRVRAQQSYGTSIINQIMTRRLNPSTTCNRKDCLVCSHEDSKGNCKVECVCYQISCKREPCSLDFDPNKPFKFDQTDNPPAIYRGESSRTPYIRGSGHLGDYRGKKKGSTLWNHTRDAHGGVIGPDRGAKDYQMVQLEKWDKPLDRLSAEGVLISELEDLQSQGKAVCLNSKMDYKQSHTVTMNFNIGSNLPGG